MPTWSDIGSGTGHLLQGLGSAAMMGSRLATGSVFGMPAAPFLLGGGALASLAGEGLRYLSQPGETPDPYAQLRQQAIQQLQVPPPQLDINQLQNMLRQNLEQRIIPGIAHRFSGLGSGAQRSSGFARTIGQAAGSELQQLGALLPQLQMQRYQAEQGRLGNLLSAIGGERQFATQQQAAQQQRGDQTRNFLQQLLRNAGQTISDIERTDVQRADVATRALSAEDRALIDAARVLLQEGQNRPDTSQILPRG